MAVGSHGTKSDSDADYVASGAQFVEYEAFIESQLRKTRGHVRGVDIAAATMVLLAGTVSYFLVAVLIDHWLVNGGLGFWGRTTLLVLYLAVAGWWTIVQILPLLLRRINPLYAAQTIEHSRPTLKNALVNFLLFRSNPQTVHQRVFEQIEQQAAASLVGVEVESTVDRSRLVKIGYVLVALVALGAIYAMVSPKNPLRTVSRVFMPWADIAPPTSTVINEIEPGTTQAFRGQQVTVKARVQGLPDGEQVLLYYTTADRQIVDRAVEMARPSGDYRHAAVLPAGDAALQQTITYRIEAGDARSHDYEITVVAAPTIVVQAVEYRYPAYTGLLGQRLEYQGDLKAIEGTEVVIEALANQPIGQAYVDFDANGSLDLTMRADGTTARTSFRLGMSEDRKKPEYELYQLLFKNAKGQQNPQPVRHRIEVIADLAPEIQFVEPMREEIEIPLDGSAELELVASDPDFALAEVRLVVRHGGKPLLDDQLLNEPWRGQFVKKLRFSPNDHKLSAGEVVEYYAVAVDNKTPRPNRTETSRRRIRITSPTGRQEGDQLAQKDAGDEQGAGDRSQSRPGGDGDRPRDEQSPAADQEAPSNEQAASDSPEDLAARNEREQTPASEPQDDPSGDQQDQPNDARNESGGKRGDQKSARDRQDKAGDPNEPQPSGTEQQAGDNSTSGESSDGGSQQGNQSGDKQPGGQQERGRSDKQPSGNEQGGDEQGAAGPQQEGGSAGQSGKERGEQQQAPDNVASDGTNDGDAIERILKHRDQQDPNAGDRAGGKSAAKEQQHSEQSPGDKPAPGKQAEQQGEPGSGQPGRKSSADKQPGKQPSSQRGSGQEHGSKSAANHSAKNQEGGDKLDDKQQGGQQQKDKAGDAKSTFGNQSDESEQGRPSDTNEQASDQQSASDAGERDGDQSGSKAREKQQPERTPGEGQQGTENAAGKKDGDNQQDPTKRDGNQGEQGATRDNNTREDGSPQNTDTKGQGGQSKDDPTRSPGQKSQQNSEQRPDAKGGDGQQDKGESGAGKKSEDNAGSPSPQESNQPREKSQQPGSENAEEKPEGDEQSPSTSKRESDSSGESAGDRSGGGEKGGGQKANQSGTGGAGQNTAADEGAGQSDEAGDGDSSDRAGGDRQAQNQTGQQGKQPGQGSESKSAPGQEQAGGDQEPSQPAGEPSNDQKSGDQGGGTPGGEQGGANTPKGAANSAPDKQWQPGVDRAADANLEYTRKATDLALEHLKDQLADGRDDSDLLKQLGWTREEADAFVQRWEAMRGQSQAAGPKGEAARRELDETLRSLGLRPRGSTIRSGGRADDRAAGLQESRRTTPPPEYSEAFKAYTQGTSRGGK